MGQSALEKKPLVRYIIPSFQYSILPVLRDMEIIS